MPTADFDFHLPPELIAQTPAPERDQSRLLVLSRARGQVAHRGFRDLLAHLAPGDALVLNDSRVIPARLRGVNARTGGQFEMLLVAENARNDWWSLLRPGKRARIGTRIALRNAAGLPAGAHATVVEVNDAGHRRLNFDGVRDVTAALADWGEVPLPPYLNREHGPLAADRERYQTVFGRADGSVAAPTAGLHFTASLLDELRARGVRVCFVTLHVGLATFAPVKTVTLEAHRMHEERYDVGCETAKIIAEARCSGRRVVAIGTTTMRVLESVAAAHRGQVVPGAGRTRIFIHPPFRFQVVDALLTNFHLPKSTLLMLVSAFAAPGETCGRERILNAYAEAIRERYRFFSYGDAMLIL